jgi:hypothetical protein
MSQAGSFSSGSGGGAIEILDADSGSATGSTVTISGGTTGLTTSASGSTMDLTGTLNVAHGGTGDTSFTAYSVLCGGTTSTGALQNVSGLGSSGNVLTSNGAGALPTWQASPVLPAFIVGASTQNNVTGDGTTYTVLFATTIVDQDSNFSSPTFTAPVTGLYQFNFSVTMIGITSGMTSSTTQLVTTARSYLGGICNPYNVATSAGNFTFSGSFLANMTAADTCEVTVALSNGTKVSSVYGPDTWFSGYRVS